MNKQKLQFIIVSLSILIILVICAVLFIQKKDNNVADNNFSSAQKNYLSNVSPTSLITLLYSSSGATDLIKDIQYLKNQNSLGKSSFISSLVGRYVEAIQDRKTFCKKKNVSEKEFCNKTKVKLNYTLTDRNGDSIHGVKVSVDGNNSFKQNDHMYDIFAHRFRFSKKGYLDSYEKVVLGNGMSGNIDIHKSMVSTNYHIITSSQKDIQYKTPNFSYNIPANTFVSGDGTPVSGNIDVYFFDIGAKDGDISVLNLDAFDDKYNYQGGSMTTLGMPFVKAYSGEKELKISQEITGTGTIQNLERAPGIDLKHVPKNVWLTKTDLAKYNIPPFWHLDSLNGVWISSTMKILDEKGNYEFKLF